MAWTKVKTSVVVGVAVLLVASTATTLTIQHRHRSAATEKLEMRVFKVDPSIFLFNLRMAMNPTPKASTTNIVTAFFASKGMNFQPPGSIDFNRRLGLLSVNATPIDLDVIEKIVQQLNHAPPQLHNKAYFVQAPESDVESILNAGTIVDAKEINSVEILSDSQLSLLLQKIKSDGATMLAQPESEVYSRMQVQMRSGNAIVDIIPTVLTDGYTVNMKVIGGGPETLNAQVNIWDGQAVVLMSKNTNDNKTRLVVIVTTTIIDSAGKPVHSKNELSFTSSAIPPQE